MAKELIVVGGPNGSGKTTFIKEFLAEHPYPYLGADLIAAEMSPDDPHSVRVAAGREFLLRLEGHLAGKESFIVESTLSGRRFGITIVFIFSRVAGYQRRPGPGESPQRRASRPGSRCPPALSA